MMKKDLFVPMKNYELREAVRIGAVFSKCFWNNGMVTNELKTCVQTLIKWDITVKRHFRDDSMFGGRFIAGLDNYINILLDECENAEQPNEISPESFSMSHVFFQVECGTFNFSLPGILKQKRPHVESEVTENKRKKVRIENPENDNLEKNDCMIVSEWKLTPEEEQKFKEPFNPKVVAYCPIHSSGWKLCYEFAVKRYCFKDCPNKESHKKWSKLEKTKFDAFQANARRMWPEKSGKNIILH